MCAAGPTKWQDLGVVLMGEDNAYMLEIIRADFPNDIQAHIRFVKSVLTNVDLAGNINWSK